VPSLVPNPSQAFNKRLYLGDNGSMPS
jgi:hypothetical protein